MKDPKPLLDGRAEAYAILPLVALEAAVLFVTVSAKQFDFFPIEGPILIGGLVAAFLLAYFHTRIVAHWNGATPFLFGANYLIYVGLLVSPVPPYALWLLSMPIISYAVMLLRWPWAVVISVMYLVTTVLMTAPAGKPWKLVLVEGLAGYGVAYVFTAVFSVAVTRALRAKSESAKLARELEEANAQLRANAEQQAQYAATQERNRIARDIHDGVGHYLTVVTVQIQAARALLAQAPEKSDANLKIAEEFTQKALAEVRNSVRALREQRERKALPAAVEALTKECGLNATLTVKGATREASPAVEEALFRAAQEGLTNVRKHAAATAVKLVLEYEPKRIVLEVSDNGASAPKPLGEGGFGLIGVRERLQAVGGTLRAGERREGGFALMVEVPA